MSFSWSVPTIFGIVRANLVLVVLASVLLLYSVSAHAAVGCLLGGAVVIANLWLLAALGRMLLGAASGGISRASARLGMLALPLKVLIFIGLIYLAFSRTHIDALGFGFGVLTQFAAIIIETGRVCVRASAKGPARGESSAA